MILTESDLHAYNRGELPPDAVRQLEEDPLAMQDAARLRAISEAVRQEAPIAVVGRAETLERLRQRAKPRVRTSGWLWAAGAASVAGLVFVSLPRPERPVFALQEAAFSTAEAAPSQAKAATPSALASERQAPLPQSAAGVILQEEARTSMDTPSGPMAAAPSRLQGQNRNRAIDADLLGGVEGSRTATLSLRVVDPTQAANQAATIAKRYGGIVASRSAGSEADVSSEVLRLRLPDGKLEALVEQAKKLGTSLGENVPAETATEIERTEERLDAMKEEERALERLMDETTDRAELVRLRERLDRVRTAMAAETKVVRRAEASVRTATLVLTLSKSARD